jgi:serine/threonine-protein kinase
VWTTPFIVFGLWRFGRLMARRDNPVSPTDAMLHDAAFLANLVAWAVVVVVILYRGLSFPAAAPVPSSSPPPPVSAPGATVSSAPRNPAAWLRIRSVPFGATVTLDGEPLGTTPLEVSIPTRAEKRHLALHLPGYEVRQLDLVIDQDVGFGLNLKKLPESPAEAP